jgi:hypothetical protein
MGRVALASLRGVPEHPTPNLYLALNPLPNPNLPLNLSLLSRRVVAIISSIAFTRHSKIDGSLAYFALLGVILIFRKATGPWLP